MAERNQAAFPPQEYWLLDLRDKKNRMQTPVDDRGLVKTDEVIEMVNSTVASEYVWSGEPDIHHTRGRESRYPYVRAPYNPARFYELPVNRVYFPRDFHNVLTRIMLEPPVPSRQKMAYQNELWSIIAALYDKAEDTEAAAYRQVRRRQDVALGFVALKEEFQGEDRYGEE
jgi:hypothetical protein